MSEQKQAEQPTIEGIEYSIIKQVGAVVDFGKRAQADLQKMQAQVIELAKTAPPATLDKLNLGHLKQSKKPKE